MNKCINCNVEYEAKRITSKYCSDACKLAYHRNGKVSVSTEPAYIIGDDTKVYGRQAVTYNIAEPWDTRPEPLNSDDKPVVNNRGRYTRQDGTGYQFDCTGQVFNLVNGKIGKKIA